MSYKDPEKKKAKDLAYRITNRKKISIRKKETYQANRDKVLAQQKEYYAAKCETIKARNKKYKVANREKIVAQNKKYYVSNRVKLNAASKAYNVVNREKRNTYLREYYFHQKNSPNFRIKQTLRSRLSRELAGKSKSDRTLALLGCTIEFLREHLEKQFQPGMTWDNYGPVWHVDHILPCAEFHLQHSEEQEICFHWTNLQPLFAADNLSKSDKIL